MTFRRQGISLLADHLSESATVVHAGAGDGAETEQLARMFPAGRVYAFEPEPIARRNLRRLLPLGNVTCNEAALADTDGAAMLNVSDGIHGTAESSLLEPADDDGLGRTRMRVRRQTLDSWAELNDVGRVDAIVLDVQGMELAVLAGSPRMVSEATAVVVYVCGPGRFDGGSTVADVEGLLASHGFDVAVPDGGTVFAVRRG